MTSSMSHGNRWRSVSSKLSLSTRFVCARTSFSTNFWSSLFLLWEWIHPSTDQQCSHADAEHMTPETLYANHINNGTWGCGLPSIWHDGASNFLHFWLQPRHVLFIQPLVCRRNDFPSECMAMWQSSVPLSKSCSLAHAHGCLSHARSCDKGLPKERIINKSWRKTIPDNRLARREHSW